MKTKDRLLKILDGTEMNYDDVNKLFGDFISEYTINYRDVVITRESGETVRLNSRNLLIKF